MDEEPFSSPPRTSDNWPPNGKPGWRDVLAAVERSEDRLSAKIEVNTLKIDRVEEFQRNHPLAKDPVERPVVDELCFKVDKLEGRFDKVDGQISAMKVISSTVAAIIGVLIASAGVFFAANL